MIIEPLSPQDLCLSPHQSESDSKRLLAIPFPRKLVLRTCKPFHKLLCSVRRSACPPPRFPVEIIQLIIHEAWALPLTTSERIRFTKSAVLVSFGWMRIFARESCVHVHLLSGLDGPTVRHLCRTITFHCIDPRDVPQPPEATHPAHPMCLATNQISGIVRHGGFDNFEGFGRSK
ncbi:hypothetical protein BT96DRAFT_1016727 [Gymnopus androsaceus JB14]|uniref:Uncharacterized protein n=1 Tax=Gymnopus androsaceus JB14 TaxID=1447944 RepID=A0A6A4I1P6_9AGAR|nr:hypothetical protein BT96DRAFT_1016727 [Gymnopus androsaceus JB14]